MFLLSTLLPLHAFQLLCLPLLLLTLSLAILFGLLFSYALLLQLFLLAIGCNQSIPYHLSLLDGRIAQVFGPIEVHGNGNCQILVHLLMNQLHPSELIHRFYETNVLAELDIAFKVHFLIEAKLLHARHMRLHL